MKEKPQRHITRVPTLYIDQPVADWTKVAPAVGYQRSGAIRPGAPAIPRNRVLVGDAVERLRQLPDQSVDAIVTSPPYHLLRRYHAGDQEIGTEPAVGEYVESIVAVFDELARVLKPTGVAWLNIGDSYSRHRRYGAPPKSVLLAPERVLLALSERDWIVRAKAVWHKPNHMPASVTDRLTGAWEPLYMLVRSPSYFFDLDAIRVPHSSTRKPIRNHISDKYGNKHYAGPLAGLQDGLTRNRLAGTVGHPIGKNPADVWTIPTAGFRGAHFAVFPERLVERPIIATCPERVCVRCGRPWHRQRRRDRLGDLEPECACGVNWRPGLVLDPFIGSGTVGVVAERMGRDWLGIELNPDYAALAEKRIADARASPKAT
jgi:site-specific DNA-methyltransferase (adenine-specific)